MRSRHSGHKSSFQRDRDNLYARLQARRHEIEQTTLSRVYAVSDPTDVVDPQYVAGLRLAVAAALDYGFEGIERGEESPPPIPVALLAQARLAARNKINLDTVLRRYFAGYTLLGDFLIQEADGGELLDVVALKRLLRIQATFFDRLVVAVTDEYTRESGRRLDTAEQRRAMLVEKILAGEFLDTSQLAYDFDVNHLGMVAVGFGAPQAIQGLAKDLNCRLLLVQRGEGTIWAWLGARRPPDMEKFNHLASEKMPAQASLAVGEAGQGLLSWRLTHQQAHAALPVVLRSPRRVVRYSEVALLATALKDDLLATSLRELYLAPLIRRPDGGKSLCETLRAYFAADRNVSSAAAALGVSRRTVANRLRVIEAEVGEPLTSALCKLEVAVSLAGLNEWQAGESSEASRLRV